MIAWHATSAEATERRQRWAKGHVQTVLARGYRGLARRRTDIVKCEHLHKTRSAAEECAKSLIKGLDSAV